MGDFQKEKQEGMKRFSKRNGVMEYPCPTHHSRPLESFAEP